MIHWQLTDEAEAAAEREPRDSTDHLHTAPARLCVFGGSWTSNGTFGAAESASPTRYTAGAKTKDLPLVTGYIMQSGLLQANAVQSFSNAPCLPEEPLHH